MGNMTNADYYWLAKQESYNRWGVNAITTSAYEAKTSIAFPITGGQYLLVNKATRKIKLVNLNDLPPGKFITVNPNKSISDLKANDKITIGSLAFTNNKDFELSRDQDYLIECELDQGIGQVKFNQSLTLLTNKANYQVLSVTTNKVTFTDGRQKKIKRVKLQAIN